MKAFFTTTFLLAGLTALFMLAGFLLGGQQGAVLALGFAALMNLGAYWMSDRLVLAQYQAREVSESEAPNFYAIVRELALRAGLPMPKVYLIQSDQPNAFATGRSPRHAAVAATTGLLQRLSRDEIAGVMAHELAHVRNRDMLTMTIAATLAGALGYLAQFGYMMGAMSHSSQERQRSPLAPLAMLLVMILGPLAALLVQMAISRTREYEADRMGGQISGNPRALASALAAISRDSALIPLRQAEVNPATAHLFIANPLTGGGLARLFATHPPMDERIRRLLAMEGEVVTARSSVPAAGGKAAAYRRGPWG